jgi:uncharacterized protein (TIGR00369 family)
LNSRAAEQILAANFAPWVLDLGLRVESVTKDRAVLRMPFSERIVRVGGTVCGQALMSAADTAMVLALSSALGEFKPMTTVSQNVSFMRPISGQDVLVAARVIRLGKTLAFGEIELRAANDDRPAAHATTTYAILG